MSAIRENGATSGIGVLASYAYDDLGRRTSLTYGNGTVTTYGFDAVSRLSSLSHNLDGATTTNDVATTFGYSPADAIATQTRTNDLYAWGDHHNVARGYTSNGLNQLIASGATALGYDARGNLTSSGSDSFTYSSENLLKSAPSASLYYDALLRLVEYDTSVSTRMLYDGDHLIAEVSNPGGAVTKRYVFGPGADAPLVEYAGSGTGSGVRTFLHADERGSIVARSNESGAKTAILSYDEYGIPNSGSTGRFQYTGQAWLPEVGVYYYKARMYSPSLGRFMQSDPIGYGDGMNWYAYVGNDPVNATDPTGEDIVVKGDPCSLGIGCGRISDPEEIRRFFDRARELGVSTDGAVEFVATAKKPEDSQNWSWPVDRCGVGYKVADWGLWGIGLIGDGMVVVGFLTLQPELVVAGWTVRGATAGSFALHISGGDAGSAAGDVLGHAAGLIPGGGTLMRRTGIDISRNRLGQYLSNQAGRYAAQNEAVKIGQSRYIGGIAGAAGGC